MKGNFSRLTRPGERPGFSSVLLQQGRVLLDSDWNDLVQILEREIRVRTRMIVGEAGGPVGDEGFGLHLECGVDLNGGGQRDRQHGQSIGLRRRSSLPFREASADLPYTLELAFFVPEIGSCGELPRAVLLQVPGRWTIYLEADLCLSLRGPDDHVLQRLGKVEAGRLQTLCVSYDGGRRLSVWHYARPLQKGLRCDEIDCPAWEQMNLAPSRFGLTIGGSHRGDDNLRCTFAGLWILDAVIEVGSEPGRGESGALSCQAVCALDLCAIEPRPELSDAIIRDTSGKSNHGQIRLRSSEQILPPVRLLGLQVGAGRYLVGGLEVHNPRPIGFLAQPWGGGELPVTGRRTDLAYLFYLEVWERFVSALQVPQIVEPALGGPDTTARTETVWQVRALVGDDAAGVEHRWKALETRRRQPGLARIFRPEGEMGHAGNRLYRVEIHHPGWARSQEPRKETSSHVVVDIVSSRSVTVHEIDIAAMLAVDSPVLLWSEGGAHEPHLTRVTCVEGSRRFELASLPSPMAADLRLQPVATFKWSCVNGAVAFPVAEATKNGGKTEPTPASDRGHKAPAPWTFALTNPGYNGFDVRVGNWVELVDDETDLARSGGLFFRILSVDINQLLITAAPTRDLEKLDLGSNPVLRRWEVSHPRADSGASSGLPPPLGLTTRSQHLEHAIHAGFDGAGFYAGGDYWVTPVRDEVGDGLIGPGQSYLPPQGIALHDAKLATLELGLGRSRACDLRRKFAPLTEITERAAPQSDETKKKDVTVLIDALFNQAWLGRAAVLVEGDGDLPGMERTGASVESRSLATEAWHPVEANEAPKGPGVALLWQHRPVFLGHAPLRLDEAGMWRPLAAFDRRVDFAAAACGSQLWLFGGSARESGFMAAIKVLASPQATAWHTIEGTALNPPARGLAAVTLAARIHILGGVSEEGPLKTHLIFDPKTLGFVPAAAMPTVRKNFALVAHEGLLYAIGGCDSSDAYLATIDCYDPDSDTWSTLSPAPGSPEPDPRADLAAASIPEGIVIVGGFDGAARTETWLFRPRLRRFQALAPLTAGRSRHGLVATSDWSEPDKPAIYAIGGVDDRRQSLPVEALFLTRRYHLLRPGRS